MVPFCKDKTRFSSTILFRFDTQFFGPKRGYLKKEEPFPAGRGEGQGNPVVSSVWVQDNFARK